MSLDPEEYNIYLGVGSWELGLGTWDLGLVCYVRINVHINIRKLCT